MTPQAALTAFLTTRWHVSCPVCGFEMGGVTTRESAGTWADSHPHVVTVEKVA